MKTAVCLSDLVQEMGAVVGETHLGDNPAVSGVCADTRLVGRGDIFVCMPSASRDTHEFLPEVKTKGASGAVVHSVSGLKYAEALGMSAVLVEPVGARFNFCIGRMCRLVFGDPSLAMRIVGITGTNGKTTTAWMVRNALVALGRKAAYLGTLGFQPSEEMKVLDNTTPFPVELWRLLAEARDAGVEDLVMETSSHALQERRLAGVGIDVGVFTNLSQDHLDFHGTMENYAAAKKLLFTECVAATGKAFVGAINIGDEVGSDWAREVPCRVLTYGNDVSDLRFEASEVGVDRIRYSAEYGGLEVDGEMRVGGGFNVKNANSALASLLGLGVGLEDAVRGLAEVKAVPGRFEAIENDKGFGVLVDYAHTPDGLVALLESCRELGPRRVITVFGCGGDRDRSKRPKMGEAVSRFSDVSVVTSDNPRTEDPEAIIEDVLVGVSGEKVVEIDRKRAVELAIGMAGEGDLVVIAGKGHEDYQIIGRTKYPMDDRVLAREALAGR